MVGRHFRLLAVLCAAAIIGSMFVIPGRGTGAQDEPSNQLNYRQLTNRTAGTNSLGVPILSGDGAKAVYSESLGQVEDPNNPNRIFVLSMESGAAMELDSYPALCFCSSVVDISDDGSQVISSDDVQIRAAGERNFEQLVRLTSNEITAIRISGDGQTVYFLLRRDAAIHPGETSLKQGLYAMSIYGGEPTFLAGKEAIARAVNVPVEALPGNFHLDGTGNPLDVTSDGSTVVFPAFAGAGEYVFTVPGQGGTPQVVAGPFDIVTHVAISDDGATVAWGMVQDGSYDVGILRSGKATTLIDVGNETYQPLQLSSDGKYLLVGKHGRLYDADRLLARPLATVDVIRQSGSDFLRMGMDRTSMSSDAIHFLYVFTQPAVSALEQLGTVFVGPDPRGDQPFVRDARVSKTEIPINGLAPAEATISLSWQGELISIGVVAIYLGEVDPNILVADAVDTIGNDRRRGEGIFTIHTIAYNLNVPRDDDTGSRILRVYVETKSDDGRHSAVAIDFGTLTVVGP
jgi:hypothetical protein